MGVYTYLRLWQTDERPPQPWCSQNFSMVMYARPRESARPLPAALAGAMEALTRVVGTDEEPLEEFLARDPTEERRAHWERMHAQREPAWQSPSDILAAVEAALAALQHDPEPLFACGVLDERFHTVDDLRRDLEALGTNLQWAMERGIPRVRLEAG